MQKKQRLAIFFDGTWNTEDNSTNVQHLHTLTQEGYLHDGCIQRRLYLRGVGTGVLDRVTGGGFGFGLEANVREAYNWLVSHYNCGDEIYVFGFSRGAFTARSLVGFIEICGLMERGAPLTVAQLWAGYTLISREREGQMNWWERLAGQRKSPFRKLHVLKNAEDKSLTEQILSECSRQVDIRYLGVFDTVGALGLDALAIPGIRGRMAMHHAPFATSLLENCRHALALDEHRDSFKLTPFLEDIPHDAKSSQKDFDSKLEQRWFVGSHANVGGGYPDNLLSSRPLEWVLEGATTAGLQTYALKNLDVSPGIEHWQDSFARFISPLWTHLTRTKRHYRSIDRQTVIDRKYSLSTINETVDDSVVELIRTEDKYAPLNLIAGAEHLDNDALKAALESRDAIEIWPSETFWARASLIVWCALAALGAAQFLNTFFPHAELTITQVTLLAVLVLLIERAENWGNLRAAQHPEKIVTLALRDSMHPLRLWCVVFVMVGGAGLFVDSAQMGWNALQIDLFDLRSALIDEALAWYPLLLVMAVAVLLMSVWEKSQHPLKIAGGLAAILIGILFVLFAVALVAFSAQHLLIDVIRSQGDVTLSGSFLNLQMPKPEMAGAHLLLLQLVLLAAYMTYRQTRRPDVRQGTTIGSLQKRAITPKLIGRTLSSLEEHNSFQLSAEKVERLRKRFDSLLRETLWRDIFGLVPIVVLAMSATLWIATSNSLIIEFGPLRALTALLENILTDLLPHWPIMVAFTIVANLLDDGFQLRKLDVPATPSMLFTAAGVVVNWIKWIGYLTTAVVFLILYIKLTIAVIFNSEVGGWRWVLANCTSYFVVGLIIAQMATAIRARMPAPPPSS